MAGDGTETDGVGSSVAARMRVALHGAGLNRQLAVCARQPSPLVCRVRCRPGCTAASPLCKAAGAQPCLCLYVLLLLCLAYPHVWFVCVLFVCVAAAVLLPCDRRSPLLLPRAALALLQAAPFQQFGDDEGAVGRGRDVQRGGGQERVGDILRAARSVSALDEETADVDANGSHQDFSLRHSVGSLSRYQKEHPEFVTSVFTWFLLGNIFFAIGLIMVLFSEIKAVLICRDQDFRISLHARGYMKPASAGIAELEQRESVQMRPRAYLTVGGMLMMYTGLSCIIIPLCDILDIVGLPAWPCFLLVIFGAFFAAFVITCLWLAVVWSCTRFYAALAFFTIGVSGVLLLPTGNLILTLIWIFIAFFGGWWYFSYLPESYEAVGAEQPFWVQDVGEMTVSCDPGDWGDSVTATWSNVRDDTAEAIGMKTD